MAALTVRPSDLTTGSDRSFIGSSQVIPQSAAGGGERISWAESAGRGEIRVTQAFDRSGSHAGHHRFELARWLLLLAPAAVARRRGPVPPGVAGLDGHPGPLRRCQRGLVPQGRPVPDAVAPRSRPVAPAQGRRAEETRAP